MKQKYLQYVLHRYCSEVKAPGLDGTYESITELRFPLRVQELGRKEGEHRQRRRKRGGEMSAGGGGGGGGYCD